MGWFKELCESSWKRISLGKNANNCKFYVLDIIISSIDFNFICSYKFSPNDYIKISSEFNTFFIDNIPLLERNRLNEIRRFIILIDILYERNPIIIEDSINNIDDFINVMLSYEKTYKNKFSYHKKK